MNKYNGTHFQVALMNMVDGSVQGHAAGCADLKRGKAKFAEPGQADEVWDVVCKEEAREAYNADFDEEEDGWYDINWLPCAKEIPDHTPHEELVVEEPKVTSKVGSKWTYLYLGDVLIAEISNENKALIKQFLSY